MAQTSYPFAGQSVTETQYRALARTYAPDMIRTGLACTPSTTGPAITLGSGMATVDGCAYTLDAPITLQVTPPSASYDRRAWVFLRMDTSGDNRITARLRLSSGTGTPAWTRDGSGVWETPIGFALLPANRAAFPSAAFTYVIARPAAAGAGSRAHLSAEKPQGVGRGTTKRGLLTARATYGPSGTVIWVADMDLWMKSTNIAAVLSIDCDGGQGASGVWRSHTLDHGPCMMHSHGMRVAQGKPGGSCTASVGLMVEATSSGGVTVGECALTPISI